MSEASTILVRVHYEDTDAGGVVYHGSYVRFFERARAEFMRGLGVPDLWPPREMIFVVRTMTLEYMRPAYLEDILQVEAKPLRRGRVYVDFGHCVTREGEMLVKGEARLVCASGKPLRATTLPRELSEAVDKEIN